MRQRLAVRNIHSISYHALIPSTLPTYFALHYLFLSPPAGFKPNFAIFAPGDSSGYLLDLSVVLFSYSIYFFRSNKNWRIITTVADTRVTSVIETYQRRLYEKSYVPPTKFGHAMLSTSGIASKLFIAFLFSDVGVQFFKNVELIPSSLVYCKGGSQMF